MKKHRHILICFLLAAGAGFAPVLPAGRAGEKEELAERARAVLRKHCVSCHGNAGKARADLRVLRHPLLIEHQLIQPGAPDKSELLQLVEAGSMPPGRLAKVPEAERKTLRDWIAAGAVAFAVEPADADVLRAIAADIRGLLERDRPSVGRQRYISFRHLLGPAPSEKERDWCRVALLTVLNQLSWKAEPVGITPIDAARTIYRIDLRDAGWDERPFVAWKGRQDKEPSRVNVFDLFLLEYPLAPLAPALDDPAFAAYREQAELVRPIVYVRGDWFVRQALQPPLHKDLLRLPRTMAEVEKKLGIDASDARAWLTRAAASPPPDGPLLLPLDGLTHRRHEPPGEPAAVTFQTINRKTGKATTVFVPGDELVVEVTNRGKEAIHFELISTLMNGHRIIQEPLRKLDPGATYRYPRDRRANPREFVPIDAELGKDQYTLYTSTVPLPAGVRLRGANLADRVVHPFYVLAADKKRIVAAFDPAKLVKRTIEIETREAK